ncbi:hypothetical protein TSUD_254540 [Trifolium subterraneum]|uniref:DUF3741 domain-containing protein n=1 Tax=Trifolium subterraneum TaxID=3900 RepID=A0A2Z6NQW6_TRISU|nr:hypothetical protein TSUD_254540 [Trifolium subterraneum]
MAKRSDFAQKLLDDLRLRKERMAATTSHSHNSNQSRHLPIDAYAYTKQTYRGSTNTRANEIVSSRNGKMVNMSSRKQRSLKSGGNLSNQIIPYGKAFEHNGGKLRRADLSFTNSILGFLHQIQRGTMDRGGNLERQLASTSQTLSHVQINEISKGAHKLNHILRACFSNGANMDTYSLNFAKELLQGAIDLEDSIRMLVDLQKSSEFMITSQAHNKNRITLLEEKEEEDNEEGERRSMEKMQLAHPTFLFDNKMQRPITITNSKEARKIKDSQQKRISADTGGAADISNQMVDEGRIPNVIAKLMGLENHPKKDSENSNIASSKHSAKGSGITTLKSKQIDNLIKNQKVAVGSFKNLMFGSLDTNLVLKNQKATYYSESEVVGIKALKGFDKASIINGSARQNYVEAMMGRKQDHPQNSGTLKGRSTNGNDVGQNLNNMHERRSQVKPAIQIAKEEHTVTNKHMQMNNEKKSWDHLVVQKSILSTGGGSEMTPKNSPKQSFNNVQKKKKKSSINQPKKSSGDHDIVASSEKVKEIINRKKSSPRYQEFERANGRQTLKDHKLATSNKIKPKKIEQILSRSRQEACDRASGKFNVLNGAEHKRFSMFVEQELLPPTTLYNSGGSGDLQEPDNDLKYQAVQRAAINLPDQAVPEAPREGFKTSEVAYHKSKTNGVLEDRMGVKLQDQNINIQQPLTESENCLKWILVMSQLFINTAEALFRLNIPFGILQGGRQDSQDQSSKLILDCGYEVMKRKGIRQELKVHTCSKISSITSTFNLIRSLDDLVRKLNEDMEKLKFYGRKKSSQVDVEDYLPKMLEHDVYDKCPDIDCMWDLGWNDETFAFIEKYDVIRDTEKHILSVLLDEITKDYCTIKKD